VSSNRATGFEGNAPSVHAIERGGTEKNSMAKKALRRGVVGMVAWPEKSWRE